MDVILFLQPPHMAIESRALAYSDSEYSHLSTRVKWIIPTLYKILFILWQNMLKEKEGKSLLHRAFSVSYKTFGQIDKVQAT